MTEPAPDAMGIAELAERAGVTARTIRYYVAEGLLPSPLGAGQQRVYTTDHLRQLQAIRRLKEAYLPLGEIRRRMAEFTPADLDRLIASEPAPASSALEYLRRIQAPDLARQTREPGPVDGRSFAAAPSPMLASLHAPASRIAAGDSPAARLPVGFARSAGEGVADTVWHRVTLAPGVELHYQPSGNRRHDDAIAHIVRAAAHILAEKPVVEKSEDRSQKSEDASKHSNF